MDGKPENAAPIVSSSAGATEPGISRRDVMNAMTAVTAVPAAAFLPIPNALAAVPSVGRAAWDRAVEQLARIDAEYLKLNAEHTAAFDAAEAECPRVGWFFSQYDLGCYADQKAGRERNMRAALIRVVNERVDKLGRSLTSEEAKAARADATRIVDEFDAHNQRRDAAHGAHNCDELEERFNSLVDKRWKAQCAVISAQAPDQAAVLAKLDLLIEMMDGQDDLGRVTEIRNDMRRLLAS